MDEDRAIAALAALAHAHRLAIFRLLVREGPSGLPAGRIGEALAIAPSALSFHLASLDHAGLLRSRRDGRHVFYAVEVPAMRGLLGFLTASSSWLGPQALPFCPSSLCASGLVWPA